MTLLERWDSKGNAGYISNETIRRAHMPKGVLLVPVAVLTWIQGWVRNGDG